MYQSYHCLYSDSSNSKEFTSELSEEELPLSLLILGLVKIGGVAVVVVARDSGWGVAGDLKGS